MHSLSHDSIDYSLHGFVLEEGILGEVNSVMDDVARYGRKSKKIVSSVTCTSFSHVHQCHMYVSVTCTSVSHVRQCLVTMCYKLSLTCESTSTQSFLPSSLAILRYLVHSQEDLRGEVSNTPRSLMSIFVAALAVQDIPQALYHCVKLIMYVAFSGVAYITHPTLGRGFALPNELQDR